MADDLILAVGWSLVQFVWQGTLVGAVTGFLLFVLRSRSASVRYLVASAGLGVMFVVAMGTFGWYSAHDVVFDAPQALDGSAPAGPAFMPGATESPSATPPTPDLKAGPARSPWSVAWIRAAVEPWLPTAVLLWICGVAALSLNLLRGWFAVHRLRHLAAPLVAGEWPARVALVARRLRLTRTVVVLESALVEVPAVIGWLRPALLLPASALTGLAPAQIDAIVAHELAHVRRFDYLVNLLQSAIETLLFFHPAVWWVSHRIRVEREHCCDDIAVDVCGDRLTYARALVSLEAVRQSSAGFALAATDGSLVARLRRVLEAPSTKARGDGWLLSCAGVVVVLLALTGGSAISAPVVPGPSIALPSELPAVVPVAWDQAPVPGVAAPPVVPPTSTGATVRGRVTVAGSGQVVRGALLMIGPVPREPSKAQVVYTDDQGRYEFRNIEAGRYSVSARKDGFIEMSYGESRPEQGGKILELAAGASVADVNFSLPRGGVITGVVVDQFGEPVARASVSARALVHRGGYRSVTNLTLASITNDVGEFRLYGLPPASYVVQVSKYAAFNTAPGATTGNLSAYTQVYAPNATSLAGAQVVVIEPGRVVGNINVTLGALRRARAVSGVAIGPDNRPMSGPSRVYVYQAGAIPPAVGGSSALPANGSFSIPGVFPGTYELRALLPAAASVATITVGDEDVTNVVLRPLKMPMVRGRVVVDAQVQSQLTAAAVRIGAASTDPSNSPGWAPAAVAINPDLTFEMHGLPGGWIFTPTLPAGWTLKAVRARGDDVTDEITLKEGENVSDLEIEVTNRPAQLAGSVRGLRGEAVEEFTALVFARDVAKRGRGSRYFAMTRGDQSGTFKVSTLAPGDYYAIALPYVNVNEAQSPDLLERLSRDATPFSLLDGETKSIELRLQP